MAQSLMKIGYFPGCSLATSAKESNESLVKACEYIGLELVEVEDWNCCGSSSAHSLDHDLALGLVSRNLTLANQDIPLMVMCPSCYRQLLSGHVALKNDPKLRRYWETRWGGTINPDLKIVSFLETLHFVKNMVALGTLEAPQIKRRLEGLKVAVYMGCMGMFPPKLRQINISPELLENQLKEYGATPITWAHKNRCCGTFLSVARPDIVGPMVNSIMESAVKAGADCLVTACAMCQLNLEIRCTYETKLPIFHFTEMAALVMGAEGHESWFSRHLFDPRPLLREKGLAAAK